MKISLERTVYDLVTVLSHLFDALLQVTGKSAAKLILSVDARQKVRKAFFHQN